MASEDVFMDAFICDYQCAAVAEGLAKYQIPDDWCAEFDAHDGIYPVICMQTYQIRSNPAMMDLKVRTAEKDEYPGCMIYAQKKTIAFKIDCMRDLIEAMKNSGLRCEMDE